MWLHSMGRAARQPVDRMGISASDMHGNVRAWVVIFQKWVQRLDQERLHSGSSVGEFGLNMKHSTQIDSLAAQIVGAVHERDGAGNPEREAGKSGYTIL